MQPFPNQKHPVSCAFPNQNSRKALPFPNQSARFFIHFQTNNTPKAAQNNGTRQRGFPVVGGRFPGHGGENFLLLLPKIRPPVTENPPSLCRKATRLQPLMPPPHTHTANSAHRKARVHKDKLFARIAYFLHTNLHKNKSSC